MAGDNVQEREQDYLTEEDEQLIQREVDRWPQRERDYYKAASVLADTEKKFSEEFLLAKTQDVTDKMAEHMATVRVGKTLRTAQALEYIARKRLDAS